jgi:hypothetical protein
MGQASAIPDLMCKPQDGAARLPVWDVSDKPFIMLGQTAQHFLTSGIASDPAWDITGRWQSH